jgi:SAM-dependent methyltransferase
MLNWLTRYAFVRDELDIAPDGQLRESVLDVGCGPHGLSTALPRATFAGVDLSFPGPVAAGMVAFRDQPGPFPFADDSFDTVVCLDVLEHVPPADRAGFVAELARVAARRVLVACPCDEGAWIDDLLRETYAARGIPAPGWLNEHDEFGLPTAAEIAGFCREVSGFDVRELAMTNGLLSTLAVIADMLPEFAARAAAEYEQAAPEWLDLFSAGRFGDCHRKGYVLEPVSSRSALIEGASLRETIWSAVRCPACDELGLEPGPVGGRCDGCGYTPGRDPSGAFDLTTPGVVAGRRGAPGGAHGGAPGGAHGGAPGGARGAAPGGAPGELRAVNSSASHRLLLAPDWERPASWLPALARYVAGVEPGADAVLCVDATTTTLGLSTVHEMLALACETFSGGDRFADVLVLDEPFLRNGLRPVAGADEVSAALELRPSVRPAEPELISEHAREAKRLHDAVRAIAERRRYLDAGDPWANQTPLVTVRIATWKGHQLLVERAIPSVLNGSYPNVEVIVCSDGPDPVAREAVEAVGDRRVRYLELPERPTYPEQSWSFWETAGIHAVNHALEHASGAFIAPLDHDDAFTDDHLHVLLGAAAGAKADLAYGQALMQSANGTWGTCGSAPLRHGHVAHGAALYSARLAHLRMDADCWLLAEPGDWNMWRRITELGVPAAFVERVVLARFQERSSIDSRDDADRGLDRMFRAPHEVATDLVRTGLDWLLDCPLPAAALSR